MEGPELRGVAHEAAEVRARRRVVAEGAVASKRQREEPRDRVDAAPAVAVLGAGSWGTALAALIARHGCPTVLWGRDAATISAIDGRHENPRYLPGIPLPETLRATTDLATALAGCDLVLVVVPSHAFAETLRQLAPLRPAHAGVAWATKGFEPGSGRFLH